MTQLSDEQVRRFITNGFIVLQPDVAPETHVGIDRQIQAAFTDEGWFGNNIGARIPALFEIVRSPVIDSAIGALAGTDYLVHPHRAIHHSTPIEDRSVRYDKGENGPVMGKGSNAGSGWHQDAQSPLARARHHLPRFLIGFYFPRETPREMGPTRVQAGSYLYPHPSTARHVVLPERMPQGSFVLLHFDMVHAAFPNYTEVDRNMVKFVFARTSPPTEPMWDNRVSAWQRPDGCIPDDDGDLAWSYLWSWLRGEAWPPVDLNTADDNSEDSPFHALSAIYRDAATANIDDLIATLRKRAGLNLHERVLHTSTDGKVLPVDSVKPYPRRWNERAVVMEDVTYSLAAAGARAVPALHELLSDLDPWVQINTVFALGEIGAPAAVAIPEMVSLLASDESTVVRQTLDALALMGRSVDAALPRVDQLLTTEHPRWQQELVGRGWSAQDQVRMNAAQLMLSGLYNGTDCQALERLARLALADRCGYVSAISVELLRRIGTPSATECALDFLMARRFDDTLRGRKKAF
ncbi:MAG: HEAT repeat domain-containing protein [Proteobacteria bacterium]|nr:HEAT repeat domain-containing protein [Pseudomonadota bacterium]